MGALQKSSSLKSIFGATKKEAKHLQTPRGRSTEDALPIKLRDKWGTKLVVINWKNWKHCWIHGVLPNNVLLYICKYTIIYVYIYILHIHLYNIYWYFSYHLILQILSINNQTQLHRICVFLVLVFHANFGETGYRRSNSFKLEIFSFGSIQSTVSTVHFEWPRNN